MIGYLNIIRLIVKNKEQLKSNNILTTLKLLVSNFINEQIYEIRIVIYNYYFNATSWTDAVKAVGQSPHEMQKKILDACIEWDKKQML